MTTPALDLAAVLDHVVDSVTVQDSSGRLIYANASAARMLGFATPQDLIDADPASWSARYAVYDEHGAPLPWDRLPGRLVLAGHEAPEVLIRFHDGATGEDGWAVAHASPLTAADGSRMAVNIVRDVTERVRAEAALEERRRFEEQVAATSPAILFVFDFAEHRLVYANQALTRLLGYTLGTIEAKLEPPFVALLHPEDQVRVSERMAEIEAAVDGAVIEQVFRVRHADGHWRWLAARMTVLTRTSDGRTHHIIGAALDVTEQRAAEDAVRTSEARYRDVVDLQTELVSRYLPDTTLTFVNDAYCRYFEKTREEVVGTPFLDSMPPSAQTFMLESIETIMASSEPVTYEHEVNMPDGSIRVLQWIDSAVRDSNGDVVELQGVGRDITAQRAAENALRESEARYRAVVDLQTELVARYLPDSTLTFVNDAYCRFFGGTKEDLIGRRFVEHDPPWTYEATLLRLETIDSSAELVTDLQEEYLPDGSVGWVQWTNRAIRDSNGVMVEIQAVGRDVTAQRVAEVALRESEARYRAVVDLQSELIARYLPDTTLTFVNDAYCRFFDKSRDELIGIRFLELDPASTRDSTLRRLQVVLESSEPVVLEHDMFMPDGTLGSVQWTMRAIRTADGTPVEIQGVGRDVTELRRIELALRESESRYREVLDSQTDVICRYLPDTTLTYVNDAYCRGFGRTKEELIGSRFLDLIPTFSHDYVLGRIELVRVSEVPLTYEHEVYLLDGTIGHMQWVDRAIRDANGVVIEFQGVGRDITELRRAEDALRASDAHLRLALDSAAMGTWDWATESGWISWSEQTGPLYGLPAGTPGATLEEIYARIHPEDRALVQMENAKLGPEATDYAVEYRTVQPDGTIRWLERRGRAVARDADGNVTRYLGVTMDVTARKQAEGTLRRLSHRLIKLQDDERRRLARDLHDGVSQDVFAITVALAAIEEVHPRLNSRLRVELAEAHRLAENVLRALRTHTYLLHPPVLDLAGIAPALREYAAGLSRRGEFDVNASAVEDVGRLPVEVETTLFRVAQEALSNVVRHAATNRATMTLRAEGSVVELSVTDRGKGRTTDEAPLGTLSIGVGIPGMRERLRQIGGELHVSSRPGLTTVTARAPMEPAAFATDLFAVPEQLED